MEKVVQILSMIFLQIKAKKNPEHCWFIKITSLNPERGLRHFLRCIWEHCTCAQFVNVAGTWYIFVLLLHMQIVPAVLLQNHNS